MPSDNKRTSGLAAASWADPPLLAAHADTLRAHDRHYKYAVSEIGNLKDFCFADGLQTFGLHRDRTNGGWHYREWAPAATACSLVGDFNSWDPTRHPCRVNADGVFYVFVPDHDGLRPGSRYKAALTVRSRAGTEQLVHCMPAWARQTQQDPLTGEMYALATSADELLRYRWRHPRPAPPQKTGRPVRIYEVHVGISAVEPKIAGWAHFRLHILPRVVALGYTALLLIAAQEHGYYASFGYQVSSFLAPPCRFGSPMELQELVDAAHGYGLLVLFEAVHSHASSNAKEGLGGFDGDGGGGGKPPTTQASWITAAGGGGGGGYFLQGSDGWHAEWGTRMFDYGKVEVIRLLLSSLCWYAECYRADGFRFDAVSAALYRHRGLDGAASFDSPDCYADHFDASPKGLDLAALTYFKLANLLLHQLASPPLLTIAEEYSGWPGLCASVPNGGVGFDYRQAMGLPPLWERLCAQICGNTSGGDGSRSSGREDEDEPKPPPHQYIDMGFLVRSLCSRRSEERRLAYVECHDQSLVGGQSFAFRAIGSDMYHRMAIDVSNGERASSSSASSSSSSSALQKPPEPPLLQPSRRVEVGMALHRLSRLLTYSLCGEAYLTFMGNEFGHPEWIDLPREGNGHSLERARRRWDLADDPKLRYGQLYDFEVAMHRVHDSHPWLDAPAPTSRGDGTIGCCEQKQCLWFVRGSCWFGFNLHTTQATTLLWPVVHKGRSRPHASPPSPSAIETEPLEARAAATGGLRVLLDSDAARFGGRGGRTAARVTSLADGGEAVSLQLPPLTGCVLEGWQRRR